MSCNCGSFLGRFHWFGTLGNLVSVAMSLSLLHAYVIVHELGARSLTLYP
jgi:hypothetical protein